MDNLLNCFWVACKSSSLVAVACFLPDRAKDLSAPGIFIIPWSTGCSVLLLKRCKNITLILVWLNCKAAKQENVTPFCLLGRASSERCMSTLTKACFNQMFFPQKGRASLYLIALNLSAALWSLVMHKACYQFRIGRTRSGWLLYFINSRSWAWIELLLEDQLSLLQFCSCPFIKLGMFSIYTAKNLYLHGVKQEILATLLIKYHN